MLTGLTVVSNARNVRFLCTCYATIARCISTNSAINRSLRRSSRHEDALPRSSTEQNTSYQVDERSTRAVENGASSGPQSTANEGRAASKTGPSRKTLDHPKINFKQPLVRTSSQRQYDYSPKPGGNRIARRAAKFGRSYDFPSSSTVVQGSSGPVTPRRNGLADPDYERKRRYESLYSYDSQRGNGEDLVKPTRVIREHIAKHHESNVINEQDNLQLRQPGRRHVDSNVSFPRAYESRTPISIPYTTPASEFLYGTSVVIAALQSTRRKLYKLYMYEGENREVRDQDNRVRNSALTRNLPVETVSGDWLRLMDKMSMGRPHNGYILEASALPKLPVTSIQRVGTLEDTFTVDLDHQSREDADVNGTDPTIRHEHNFPRFPFIILLDGILDPGNLGAILRSAYFLGVDAVAISNRNSAPLSPVTLKASAGAAENLPLLSVAQPIAFIDKCKENNWKIYAGVAPSDSKMHSAGSSRPARYTTTTLGCPVRDHACMLILGGEGQGLRWNVQRKADVEIGIDGQRLGKGDVDSLNVSVAAGILCEAFLRKPMSQSRQNNRLF